MGNLFKIELLGIAYGSSYCGLVKSKNCNGLGGTF
jgi:hypothetical protein